MSERQPSNLGPLKGFGPKTGISELGTVELEEAAVPVPHSKPASTQ
jgi:hypothetical protein